MQHVPTCFKLCAVLFVVALLHTSPAAAQPPRSRTLLELTPETRTKCLSVLRSGLRSDEFWPAIHAAEGLTLGGYGSEVIEFLEPKVDSETDDQRRCGLSRELIRAGLKQYERVMLEILAGDDPYGHIHAAESLYKVSRIGDGTAMRRAFAQQENLRLRIMSAAALGRCGNPDAMTFLRETLGHDDPEISRTVAWVLGRIGDARDIPPIRALADRASDPLTNAYYEHSLAALGEDAGLEALARNLASGEGVIQTYAATFAGDAWATHLKDRLIRNLENDHLDARIRAAQSLLQMAHRLPDDPHADVSNLVYQASDENPRYTEGSILELQDGSLLYAVTEFTGSGSDFATARIIGRRSRDGGVTWGAPIVLQENTGGQNVMSVTLRRLNSPAPSGTIAMFYLEKNSYSDLKLLLKTAGESRLIGFLNAPDRAENPFGKAVPATPTPGYHVVNNDRVLQLSSGRLLAPAASTPDVKSDNHFVSRCFISEDAGQTWRPGKGAVDYAKRGAMEPEVFELHDGRVLMIVRTQLGHIAASYSSDAGETWSDPKSWNVEAPEAPATLRRIPATGDLLLIWNNNYEPGAGHGGKRTPLTAAISSDEGKSWSRIRNLEDDPSRTYSYTSLIFVENRAVLSYWESGPGAGQLSSKFRSLPVSWFYSAE
jgi:sialidase-1